MYWTNLIGSGDEVGLDECVDGCGDEEEDDEGGDDHSDNLEALEPGLPAPADGLEHAPETVHEVKPHGGEPDEIEDKDPPLAERGVQEKVRVVLEVADPEHLGKLHLGPEMGEMEADETEDHDTENKHILGGPGVSGGLAGHFVTLPAAAGLDVLPGKPASVDDVDEEAQCEDGDHDVNESRAHEIASELEQSVSGGKKLVVICDYTVLAGERVDDREEIDRRMEKEEDDLESTADTLDELLADGR